MPLGKKIAEKRKEKGLSQEALGQQVDVTSSFISQIETGTRNPTYSLLLKIGNALDTSIEYLVGGDTKGIEDPNVKIITSILNQINSSDKKKLLDYAYLLTGVKRYDNYPFFDTSVEYAQFILKSLNYSNPPVDPHKIAELLGVKIIESKTALEHEGILYKNREDPLIVLCPETNYEARRKFTIAMLIGHLIIPWHIKNIFYREKNKHSVDEIDELSIEAKEFANALLVPPFMLRNDFKSIDPCIQEFEKVASKYGSSLLVIAQNYVKYHSKTSMLLTVENNNFTRIFNAGFPFKLVDNMKAGTFADSFTNDQPNMKEIRKGFVDANLWFQNPSKGMKIYEESLLDPKFGVIVTFLKILR